MKKFLLDSPQYPTGLPKSEKLKYDTWGRFIERSKNGAVSKFKYDHFGRLVEKLEGETLTKYTYDNYGKRLSRITTKGGEILDEYNTYDKFGRLVKTQSNGKTVEYIYNKKNQLAEQIIDGNKIVFEYTKLGQLAGKTLFDKDGKPLSELKYFYSKSGKITSRLANGKLQGYKYDARSQLLAVIDMESKSAVEEYVYDASGNILKKTVNGKTTTYTYDAANQLLSSTNPEGDITSYAYDAAGRLVKEGEKTYEYGWLDKVMRVAEDGKELARFEYHNNNQLAKVVRENGIETFEWDGLALIERNGTKYINEPHVGGGNPVLAIGGETTEAIFTDMLGTSLGKVDEKGYSAIDKTSFGADTSDKLSFFTGKPYVDGLGYAFLFRNYRADMGKWLSQDLIGYPDGWNNFAYCNNDITNVVDLLGAAGHAINKVVTMTDGVTGVSFQAKILAYCSNDSNNLSISNVSAIKYGHTSYSAGIAFELKGVAFGLGASISYDSVTATLVNQRTSISGDVKTVVAEIYLTYSYTATEVLIIGNKSAAGGGNATATIECSVRMENEEEEQE